MYQLAAQENPPDSLFLELVPAQMPVPPCANEDSEQNHSNWQTRQAAAESGLLPSTA